MTRPLAAIVLAAGQGKRMRSKGPKVLAETCGRPLVEHVLDAVARLGPSRTVIVHGHGGDAVKAALHGRPLLFAHQPEQKGTGHAVQCALPTLGDHRGDILILCGDTPLLTSEVLSALIQDHQAHRRALTVLSAELAEPGSLGRILRGPDGRMRDIREFKDASPDERAIREINTGVILVDGACLPGALSRLRCDNAQGEYYLTDVPALLLRDGLAVDAFLTRDTGAALGVNTPAELAEATRILRGRILAAHLSAGVAIPDPATTVIDAGVSIGAGTVLYPFTFVERGATIGGDCRIGPHAHVAAGASIPDSAVVRPAGRGGA